MELHHLGSTFIYTLNTHYTMYTTKLLYLDKKRVHCVKVRNVSNWQPEFSEALWFIYRMRKRERNSG